LYFVDGGSASGSLKLQARKQFFPIGPPPRSLNHESISSQSKTSLNKTKTGVSDPLSHQLQLRAEARRFDRSRDVSDDNLRNLKRVPALNPDPLFGLLSCICRNIRGKRNVLVRMLPLACLIVAASLARTEGRSIFIPSPPATSISTKTQGSSSSSVDLNQAAMSQIINQLNQRQFQLSVTAAQARTSAQRSVFVPQKIIVPRAK
jgi:hypothetical protein